MKQTLLACLQLIAFITIAEPVVYSQTSSSESNITAVTVYLDRALVTRTITKRLTKGQHIVVFDNLPEAIVQNSLQATGEGKAVLKDVKFKQEFYKSVTDNDKKTLIDKMTNLSDSIVDADDVIANATKEEKAIEEMLRKIMDNASESTSKGKSQPELDPDKLIKLVTFYRNRIDVLNKQTRFIERKKRLFNADIALLQDKLNSLGRNTERSKNFVEVLLGVKDDSEITVNLSYMLQGPSWYPVYDVRVFTDTKKMNLTYQAMIQQNTTEDWNNATIKLSTARVNVKGDQPSLSPWYVSFQEYAVRRDAESLKLKKGQMLQMSNSMAVNKEITVEDSKAEAPAEIQIEAATVEKGATSAVFVVPGKNTVKSDNQQHKVTVMMNQFDAYFRYSAVPKLMQNAFLKAKVKNTSDFPLLAGATNVFLDNNFISTSQIDQVNPGQEFWTFLGVDDGIDIKYKTIKQYQKDEGLITKKNKYVYEYIIEITNNKKTEEEIVVWDQIPMANSADIKVNLEEPNLEADKDRVKMDDYNYLEWYYKIKPAEKLRIPFKFSVEGPKNRTMSGL